MQKTLLAISILLILLGCAQIHKKEGKEKDTLFFRALISPAFNEGAEITLSEMGGAQKIQFLLRDAYGNDKLSDTFYFKTVSLSESQFHKIDSELLQKTITGHSLQKSGIRDGIWLRFTFVNNGDTSVLSFDNPQRGIDSAAFEMTKIANDNFQSIFKDSVINGYLDDVQSYIDQSKKDSFLRRDRAIDKLRRMKYSRQHSALRKLG